MTEYSPLQSEIEKLIKSSGPMPVWRYMELCLMHPKHGYYLSRDPLGREGDFTTAPEVSQMFGELLGLWAASVWKAILDAYPDVAAAGIDPLRHYCDVGWKEGRDPTSWFGTRHYLRANADVAAAAINPFWHYVIAGAREGRVAKREINARRDCLEHLEAPTRTRPTATPESLKPIDEASLVDRIVGAAGKAAGLVCAISHTCYPRVTAGTELFIFDEQKRFNENSFAYFHFSPVVPDNLTTDLAADEGECWIVVDGAPIGTANYAAIARCFAASRPRLPAVRMFVVHSPQGHSADGLIAVRRSFDPNSDYFWVHNYSSLCYRDTLLRNNIQFCHAPPLSSLACEVCAFGPLRQTHVKNVRRLFEAADFHVVCPSHAARETWEAGSTLPRRSVKVQEHCQFIVDEAAHRSAKAAAKAVRKIVRVAFVGYPVLHKGWSVFERVMRETRIDPSYAFYHFAVAGVVARGRRVRAVPAKVSSEGRDEMVRLLAEHKIDIVVVSALWPETFSYVTFEALAAGCDVFTLADSGNVAATVRSTGRGRVFENEEELVGFFTSHQAVDLARIRAANPNPCGHLRHCGTTAAIVFGPASR